VKARLRHWFRPRQVVITDASSGSAARHVVIRPLRFVVTGLVLLGVGFAAGLYFSPEPDIQSWTYRLSQLEQEKSELDTKVAEQEASLNLRSDEIDSLKQQLESLQQTLAADKKQLSMFDNILNKRKIHGINIVNPSAGWLKGNRIGFQTVLVKGGNYPRRVSGHVYLIVTNVGGDEIKLTPADQPDGLPYAMEDHTLLQGSVDWTGDWKPDHVTIVVTNHRNREAARQDVPINDVPIERIPDVTK